MTHLRKLKERYLDGDILLPSIPKPDNPVLDIAWVWKHLKGKELFDGDGLPWEDDEEEK